MKSLFWDFERAILVHLSFSLLLSLLAKFVVTSVKFLDMLRNKCRPAICRERGWSLPDAVGVLCTLTHACIRQPTHWSTFQKPNCGVLQRKLWRLPISVYLNAPRALKERCRFAHDGEVKEAPHTCLGQQPKSCRGHTRLVYYRTKHIEKKEDYI